MGSRYTAAYVLEWPHRLTVRTQDFHSCNRGSIPREAAINYLRHNLPLTCFVALGAVLLTIFMTLTWFACSFAAAGFHR